MRHGHCETAAGIAGIIKACIMLFKKELPPQAGFAEVHADIDDNRIRVPTGVEPFHKGVIVCASSGYVGANVNVCLSFAQPPTDINIAYNRDRIVIPRTFFSHYTKHVLRGQIVLPASASLAFVAQNKKLRALSSISFVGAIPLWASSETETLTLKQNDLICDVLQNGHVVAKVDLSPPGDLDVVAVEGEGVPIEPKQVYKTWGTRYGFSLGGAFRSMVDYERVGRWASRATVRVPDEGAVDILVDGLMQTAAVLCDLGYAGLEPMAYHRGR